MPCYDDRNENELKIVKERLDLATRVELQSLADWRGWEVERLVGLLSAFAQVAQGAIDRTRATTPPTHKEMESDES